MSWRPRGSARRGAALLLTAALTAACSGAAGSGTFADDRGARADGPSGSGPAGCPTSYAAPDPDRPRITLAFDLTDDLRTVTGTEDVTFIPDRPVTELVFRLTPNTAPSVGEGNRIQVTAATSDPSGGAYRFERANAAPTTQGGLLVLPLGRTVPAGERVTATLAFTLTLGDGAFDRFGRSDRYAWWGTGQPLLGWERGVGWHREPMLDFTAESATSEAADIDLTVTAPAALTVLSSGTQDDPVDAEGGRRRWHAVADRARDVSVAAGPFRTASAVIDGTTVLVGTAPGTEPAGLFTEAQRAVRELSARFGPPPFPVINLARLPIGGGGIEYPGSILMLDDSRTVVVHEIAHQWFYGMVGNSQARDPWLDEAFASWAEEDVDGTGSDTGLRLPGEVGDPTADYGGDERRYYATTYEKGAAALTAARSRPARRSSPPPSAATSPPTPGGSPGRPT